MKSRNTIHDLFIDVSLDCKATNVLVSQVRALHAP